MIRIILPRLWTGLGLVATVVLAGCRAEVETDTAPEGRKASSEDRPVAGSQGDAPMTIELKSTAFAHGAAVPRQYTGDGDDVSPPLSWSNLPPGTKELALVCDDPDAPTSEPWVHWVIYKIPSELQGLPEGVATQARLKDPAGVLQGKNSWGSTGYRGPKPPPGHGVHHYHFRLYAVQAKLSVELGLSKSRLLGEMSGHVLAEGELIGTYLR